MSYHIYNTKGIILSERPLGEADRIYSILTRDLGLVKARALAVRKINSKLRGDLEPLTLANVSLVRGNEYWRATSAEVIARISATDAILQPLALVEKLNQGEQIHPELFDAVERNLDSGEITLVSQILHHLGYLKEADLNLDRKSLIQAINKGLNSSHLV